MSSRKGDTFPPSENIFHILLNVLKFFLWKYYFSLMGPFLLLRWRRSEKTSSVLIPYNFPVEWMKN